MEQSARGISPNASLWHRLVVVTLIELTAALVHTPSFFEACWSCGIWSALPALYPSADALIYHGFGDLEGNNIRQLCYLSNASACERVRGKPSSMKPFLQSAS